MYRIVVEPKIVVELGINHNGNFDTLIALADMAMTAGADFVKIQVRTPQISVPEHQKNVPRVWNGELMTYLEYKEAIELSDGDLYGLHVHMNSKWGEGKWFASVWDIPALERLLDLNIRFPYIKAPSAKLTDKNLLSAIRDTRIPAIVSTGMSTKREIISSLLDVFPRHHENLTVLSCCSAYPCADEEVNLARIDTLRDIFWDSGWNFGFSSHSSSPWPAVYSTFFDVSMIEVHGTLDRSMPGSDHAASLEQHGIELLCREVRRIPTLVGDGQIKVYPSEEEKRRSLRGS